jgi:hypothetical protein
LVFLDDDCEPGPEWLGAFDAARSGEDEASFRFLRTIELARAQGLQVGKLRLSDWRAAIAYSSSDVARSLHALRS